MITGSSTQEIAYVKQKLHNLFGIKDLGKLHYFLGFEVSYIPEGIVLSQKKFTLDLVKGSGFDCSRTVSTPFAIQLQIGP